MSTSGDLRRAYASYFQDLGHQLVASAPLVPQGDPSLLFTNSGMVQFKNVFLGLEKRPYNRAVSAQKCVRAGGKHNDLSEVGRTPRHHVYFEMLGNFSFGDYFKPEAIDFAWTFLTRDLGIAKDRLYASVFESDEQAAKLWHQVAGFGPERIARFGAKENFWEMADTGPCGPNSEIFVDLGPELACSPGCHFPCDCDRFVEVWNLVFMQYDRGQDGQLTPLPRPSVDTGMGLERMTSVLDGVRSNWQTDLFVPILARIADLAGRPYHDGEEGFSMRVVADHARSSMFLIADGVLPANGGRGYVLRRLIRRAVQMGVGLGLKSPFLPTLLPVVEGTMDGARPELNDRRSLIEGVLAAEEERFARTLEEGNRLLSRELQAVTNGTLAGSQAFLLYDSYGFPIELTEEISEAAGVTVDRIGFDQRMAEQRLQARAARSVSGGDEAAWAAVTDQLAATKFVGYERLSDDSVVLALLVGNRLVPAAGEGPTAVVVTAATPFYAAGGGQVGDVGVISSVSGRARVLETRRLAGDRIAHLVSVEEGEIAQGDGVHLAVDAETRRATERNHTATHLLHRALRDVLGDHVHQAGSVVDAQRLRFDFTHFSQPEPAQLAAVEGLVNGWILDDRAVEWRILARPEAQALGAMALFEEKYGDQVRMVEVEDCSKELCGGTHVSRTGQIGLLRVVSEGSVASGVRRITAVTGWELLARLHQRDGLVEALTHTLKVPDEQLAERVQGLLDEAVSGTEAASRARRAELEAQWTRLKGQARQVGTLQVLAAAVANCSLDDLRWLAGRWQETRAGGVLALVSNHEQRVPMVVAVDQEAQDGGLDARQLIAVIGQQVEGRGGGRLDWAQGSGQRPDGIGAAVDSLIEAVRHRLS
ncbi:MAG: alanine--tRNA ligase [Sulfobacillus sp.]